MFAKDKVSKSIVDAVNSVINEDEKKRMLLEPEIDETGFHKAAHAAKKASQTHFEFQGKKYPVTAKSQKEESSKMERVLSDNGMGGIVKTEKPILPKDSFKKKLKESLTKTKERDFSDFMVNEKEMSPGQMKKREDIVMSMKDKTSYFKKKYGKDWKNVMYATATKQAMAKEEVEQIDELSKTTLSSYLDKKKSEYMKGKTQSGSKENAKDIQNMGKAHDKMNKEEVELSEKNESHTHAAHYENDKGEWTGMNLLVAKNDQDAIKQAYEKCKEGCRLSRVERHIPVKEEVDQIDELSKSTLGSYLDKKKSEYMKGKTQSGSKENAKDIQNMGKAHDKMNKEEVELSEKNESHTHAAHYENDKGEWTGMNLLVAKNDQDAIKQAHEKCKEGCRLSRVERHIPVKEEVDQIDELKKSTLASYAKKAGDESSYYSFAAGSRSAKDPQRLVSDKLAMKRQSGVNKAIDRLAKEEVELDEEGMKDALKKLGKKTFKALTGGSDVDQRKDLQRKMGLPQTGKKPVQKEEALDMKTLTLDTLKGREKLPKGKTHDNEHTTAKVKLKAEGWDDMLKSVADRHKPQPSGGSGVKQGSRYGGSKQKEKPEQEEPKEKMKESIEDTLHPAGAALLKHIKPQHHNLYKPHLAKDTFNGSYKDRTDVLNAAKSAGHLKEEPVKEGKDPSMDAGVGSPPNFVTDESKPLKVAKELARNTMKKIKTEMLGKISN